MMVGVILPEVAFSLVDRPASRMHRTRQDSNL